MIRGLCHLARTVRFFCSPIIIVIIVIILVLLLFIY